MFKLLFRMAKLRSSLLFLMLMLSFQASADLVLKVDENKVCGGFAMLFTVEGSDLLDLSNGTHYFSYEKKIAGPGHEWKGAGLAQTESITFSDEMDTEADAMEYRVYDVSTKKYSAPVRVERDKSEECGKTCHESSTGDFIMGTDFDPKPGVTDPKIPDGVITYFDEHGIKFNKDDVDDSRYKIEQGLDKDVFGDLVPSLDGDNDNYYYNFIKCNESQQGAVNNAKPFLVEYPREANYNKTYTFTMRSYLKPLEGCNQWENSKIIARTGHGTVTDDTLEARLYNDATGDLIGEKVISNSENGGRDAAKLYMKDLMPAGDAYSNYSNQLLRLEIVFFGKMPGPEKTEKREFQPMFEQFQCSNMAIDFISADVASVCVSKGGVCLGSTTTVNAAGFGRSTVYAWQLLNENNEWENLVINGTEMVGKQFNKIDIPVTKVGKQLYRVFDKNLKEPDYFTFTVTGKECEPPTPNSITGDGNICSPTDDVKEYMPFPFTFSSDYEYHWDLILPNGEKDNSVISFPKPDTTAVAGIKFPASFETGTYYLQVELFKKVAGDLQSLGAPYKMPITLWKRPSAEFIIAQGAGNSEEKMCPYATNILLSSVEKADYLTYTWTGANETADKSEASVASSSIPCSSSSYKVKLISTVTDFLTCADTVEKTFPLDRTTPVIDCDKLGGDTSIYVSATATDTTIILPKPEISATCDGDPTVVITIKGTAANGSNIDKTLTIKKSDLADETLSVTLPITAGKVDGEKGDNGATVTYVVKDACAITSEPCSFSVFIRDTFGPVVECETMPYYVVNDSLSKYPGEACVATPGGGGNLPVLTAPSLEDKLHPGTFITGTFAGRIHNGEPEDAELNDPYKIGTTLIRWKFYDDARNSDSCFQTINVVDNKAPRVACPNVGELSVQPEGEDCYVTARGVVEQIKKQLGTDGPTATDICQPSVVLEPRYFYREVGADEWNELTMDGDIHFEIKKNDMRLHYQLQYRFYKPTGAGIDPTVYAFCDVDFKVVDNKEPEFDCDTIPNPMIWNAESGKCAAATSDLLKNWKPWPYALEACTRDSIAGELVMADGSAWPDSIPVGKIIKVRWIFQSEMTSEIKTCDKDLLVKSDNEPIFDCDKLLQDTIFIPSVPGECYAIVNPIDIPQQIAKDACTGDNVFGVPSRKDGGELYGRYELGGTVLVWTFESPYSTTPKICEQIVWVKTDREIDGGCSNEEDRLRNYPDIRVSITDGTCKTIPANVLNQLTEHTAEHPCDPSIIFTAVPSRSDGKAMDDDYPVDTIKIYWTFTDHTNTLQTKQSVCEQVVMISNDNPPVVNCREAYPDTTIYLDIDNCFADFSMIKTNLKELPVNPCNGEVAKVDTSRQSGKKINDPYEVGTDIIFWKFTFPSTGATSVCPQSIEVLDTVAPYFDCSKLKPEIRVELRDPSDVRVFFEDVVKAGFVMPTATDKCCTVTVTATRSDNLPLEDKYPIGKTTITFRFTDDHGNSSFCKQVINVMDFVPPIPDCPHVANGPLKCLSEIPEAFETYEEFVAAGGSVDPEEKVIKTSMRHEDVTTGDSCNAKVVRTYFFTTIMNEEVFCENPETFVVVDNEAPVIHGVSSNGDHFVTSCDVLDTIPPTAYVTDNCDSKPELTVTRVSTQDPDPSSCAHYTYKVTYTWNAVDRCGNAATPIVYVYDVVDTVGPDIHVPADWKKSIHPDYLGDCLFGIPSIVDAIPKDSIFQNCGDNQYLIFEQKPAAGTIVSRDTTIILTISDVCNNPFELTKKVIVQSKDDIVKLTVDSVVYVCGDDVSLSNPRGAENSLSSIDVHVSGYIWEVDFDGSWIKKNTTVVWDYYRGSINGQNIKYSNNPTTYADKFKDADNNDEAFGKYNLLLRENQTDDYYFVAYDTVSGCSGSAKTKIIVRERPRISLTSAPYNVCEGDSLELSGDFWASNPVCAEDKGAPITEQGWMVNGERYETLSPIDIANGKIQSAVYYATNACGTTTSANTLKASCFGSPVTSKDSLAEVGSLENLMLWRDDKLYTSDSITLNIYSHFNETQVLLTTKPQDKPRVWQGDDATLLLTTPYQPSYLSWRRVEGEYDAQGGAIYDRVGNIVSGGSGEFNDVDLQEEYYNKHPQHRDTSLTTSYSQTYKLRHPADSAYYYVVVGNGVCPTVSSNIVNVDVLKTLPTAITPYDRDGMNDVFMPNHHVIIYNRYGGTVFEGYNGWDGTFRGIMADPGVYYYSVYMKYGVVKGSVEVVKIR